MEQRERDLVILQPGTPHMVLTPPGACKISRNWMTPASLLAATVRVLKGEQGERGEWFEDLSCQPLACTLPALRRLQRFEPASFDRLVLDVESSAQLRFLLSRALAGPPPPSQVRPKATRRKTSVRAAEPALDFHRIASDMSSWMQTALATHQQRIVSQAAARRAPAQLLRSPPSIQPFGGPLAGLSAVAAAAAPFQTSGTPDAVPSIQNSAVNAACIARSRSFRSYLFEKLLRECPLSSTLPQIEVLLQAKLPEATVEELLYEQQQQQQQQQHVVAAESSSNGSTKSGEAAARTIEAAGKQRFMRESKTLQLGQSAAQVRAQLLKRYGELKMPLPDAWQKLADRHQEIVSHVTSSSAISSAPEVRGRFPSSLTDEEAKARRRLLLRDLTPFLVAPDSLEHAPFFHAAPEREDPMLWRAVVGGPRDTRWQWVTVELRIRFPNDYPQSPPTVTCVTPVFHPNIDIETGAICMNLLTRGEWSPSYHVEWLLVAFLSLLILPNPISPLNRNAATMFSPSAEPEECFWTRVYAVHERNMTSVEKEVQLHEGQ